MKALHYVSMVALLILCAPLVTFAEHKSEVAGQVVDSDDSAISQGEECDGKRHYHGELNGVADPAPHGCGQGVVTVIAHGAGDGESVAVKAEAKPNIFSRFASWVGGLFSSGTKDTVKNVIDVAAEANGIPPPGTVSDTVDIVVEAAPSIKENIDNIKAYREGVPEGEDTLGIYNDLTKVPENPTLSQRFFRWFATLTK